MLKISEPVFRAFEAQAAVNEVREFWRWWNARSALLGVLTAEDAKPLLDRAYAEGARVGIEDNAEHRAFLMAASLRLLPAPSAQEMLAALDAVFAPADDDARLAMLRALPGARG